HGRRPRGKPLSEWRCLRAHHRPGPRSGRRRPERARRGADERGADERGADERGADERERDAQMSRIIVTGGAGRLGRSVVRLLAESGHDVISIDRTTAGLPAQEIEADLLDAEATAALFARSGPD